MSAQLSIARLNCLPYKVSMPFQKLLTTGLLDEVTVSVVLDAGELDKNASNHPAKLLAFAAGFLYLESKNVPVRDAIRMAKTQARRVNIDWSAKRWQEEHDRLSRAETLARLAGENIRYDLSKYEALLPRFNGYLIRSSRRLGMEGLRQRHCVANRHARIMAGYCAIGSVFVDHLRWTVEITLTGDSEVPLRISEIKTRFNQAPSSVTRESIHDLLGIKLTKTGAVAGHVEEGARHYLENLRRVLPILREHGLGSVTVEFDGYGDSGSIAAIHYDVDAFDDSAIQIEVRDVESNFQPGQGWVRTQIDKQTTLHDAIEAVTYDYLTETGVDWYNNDGGFGELIINVDDGSVSLEVSTRFTESQLTYGKTLNIETEEEI